MSRLNGRENSKLKYIHVNIPKDLYEDQKEKVGTASVGGLNVYL